MITNVVGRQSTEKLTLARMESLMVRAPQLPVVVTQALRLINDPDPDFDAIIRLVSSDPALVARIISIANSTFMGRGVRATNPRTACVALGLSALRSVILAVGVVRHLKAFGVSSIVVTELWAHAFGTAVAARCIADITCAQPEMAYTAGLLHDIGKILLIQHAKPQYEEVLAYQREHDCFIFEAERDVLGFDHVDVGAMVAQLWKLPDYLCDVIRTYQTPEKSSFPEIVDAVHIADVLARSLAFGNPGDDLVPEISQLVAQRRQLTAAGLAQRFEGIELAFAEILDFID